MGLSITLSRSDETKCNRAARRPYLSGKRSPRTDVLWMHVEHLVLHRGKQNQTLNNTLHLELDPLREPWFRCLRFQGTGIDPQLEINCILTFTHQSLHPDSLGLETLNIANYCAPFVFVILKRNNYQYRTGNISACPTHADTTLSHLEKEHRQEDFRT